MNSDEFETRLRNVPRRPIPAAWRAEVLGELPTERPLVAWWKQWLWPHPAAWASLATIWVLILALHFATVSEPPGTLAVVRPAPEMLQAFHDRTRLMAELFEESPTAPAVDRPRSNRSARQVVV